MNFITKDSGERKEYPSGMHRDVYKAKPRYDLIIPLKGMGMFDRWAMLMERGAQKYGERNYELASTKEEMEHFRQAAFRHFIQWFKGEEDEDHAAAIFFNVQGAEYVKEQLKHE